MVGWLAGHVGAEVLLDRGSLHGLAVHAPVPAIWSHWIQSLYFFLSELNLKTTSQ